MSPARRFVFAGVLALLAWAGWQLVAHRHAERDASAALAEANARLRAGDADGAARIARGALTQAPGQGRAFGILARALDDETDDPASRQRYAIAARRAPRDAGVRVALAADALEGGDHAAALVQLDALLTIAPSRRQDLFGAIAQLCDDPDFADALAAHLAHRPRWRAGALRAIADTARPEAKDRLYGALRAAGDLGPDEAARWIEGMLREGRWGDAYARWFAGIDPAPSRLPVPWNGDFAAPIGGAGFDWRLRPTAGVATQRVRTSSGHALRLRFIGRPVARTGLEQPLLLAPGPHVLHWRARTDDLRSDQGLAWELACARGRAIARGAAVRQAEAWTERALAFEVPERDCDGQWLRLVNPAPRGVAQIVRGELLVSDVRISAGGEQNPHSP
ncbi:hypothetical protein [Luteimonas sp. FCS-9]|uniref:tetratricopeptide repeat protein n=1 Tax=Luteimonas sp. FCS-9 TaxID=1547516 RepID=UPI00063E87CD|nr:hypothetical protein [Luteimonas sp. FCS-9]KLJ00726.1 hypothetical protein WQ56_07980 [Luteimonas sp. FCS-9]